MIETSKKALYTAVGAPVVTVRKLSEKMDGVSARVRGDLKGRLAEAATEGEKLVSKVTDRKVVEDLTAKVDLDQYKEQVGKLRNQLEDMLKTWRVSFSPEEVKTATPVTKPAAKKATAKKAPAKKAPAAKKATAKKATAKKATAASAKN